MGESEAAMPAGGVACCSVALASCLGGAEAALRRCEEALRACQVSDTVPWSRSHTRTVPAYLSLPPMPALPYACFMPTPLLPYVAE